jgi:ADP-dependent NAD(P)H-hydrate dehydratase / NAD(P)H-hydrate epimerase
MCAELSRSHVAQLLPERAETGHKGSFGHVFILAGSRGFTGAAKLACEAAGRSGAGLVTLGVPEPLADCMAAALTETMTLSLPASADESLDYAALQQALDFAAAKDAVLIGPGLSRHPATIRFVHDFLARCLAPAIVDADALNALSEAPELLRQRKAATILTPHPGEMARLTGMSTADVQANRAEIAAQFAQEHHCAVALKGHRTVIANSKGDVAVNPTGNHGMATGGTGDVLAGLLAGLLAQGMNAYDAACLGVYLHGVAGELAAERFTPRAMIAGDILRTLPDAWRAIEAE